MVAGTFPATWRAVWAKPDQIAHVNLHPSNPLSRPQIRVPTPRKHPIEISHFAHIVAAKTLSQCRRSTQKREPEVATTPGPRIAVRSGKVWFCGRHSSGPWTRHLLPAGGLRDFGIALTIPL